MLQQSNPALSHREREAAERCVRRNVAGEGWRRIATLRVLVLAGM
jgi:hypothetical protein